MLIIQTILVQWYKEERGGKYADARSKIPKAYILKNLPPLSSSIEEKTIITSSLHFFQYETKFMDESERDRLFKGQPLKEKDWIEKQQKINVYDNIKQLRLSNLTVLPDGPDYRIKFFYEERHRGQPYRRGHNEDYHNIDSFFYAKDILNETAFILKPEQYGRIFYNERLSSYDYESAIWYYQLHIINLINSTNSSLPSDIFVSRQPDYCYSQLANLY